MLEIPGGPSKVGDCGSVAGEESHDIVKPLESGVFDGRLPSEVSVSRVAASVQEECTHVHTTAGRCIVEWGPPLFLHTREGEREREWRKSREEGSRSCTRFMLGKQCLRTTVRFCTAKNTTHLNLLVYSI